MRFPSSVCDSKSLQRDLAVEIAQEMKRWRAINGRSNGSATPGAAGSQRVSSRRELRTVEGNKWKRDIRETRRMCQDGHVNEWDEE
jgi:hypothetical protein